MTRFCDEAWRQTAASRAAIDRLPCNTELAAGTPMPERFRCYITQDALDLMRPVACHESIAAMRRPAKLIR